MSLTNAVAGIEVDPDGAADPLRLYPHTDLGNAERLCAWEGKNIVHIPGLGWHLWRDGRWQRDPDGSAVMTLACQVVRRIPAEADLIDEDSAALLRHARASESHGALRAMVALAATKRSKPLDAFDSDPMVLNVQNGTIDLETGVLHPHKRDDHLLRIAGVTYDPTAKATEWETFVRWVAKDDPELVAYLQRLAGYCLTGRVSEQAFTVFWGHGANGKSLFLEVLAHVLGDYAAPAPPGFLMSRYGEEHPTSVAGLVGRRLVTCSETEHDKRLDEARVKLLTGDERLTARYMHKDYFDFSPTFKLILATNAKPVVTGTDHGIWRRLHFVPFENTATEPNRGLKATLLKEAPGILAWAVRGCLAWQATGLAPTDRMKAASGEYRETMDQLGTWLNERCEVRPGVREEAGALYRSYAAWAKDRGEHPCSQRTLGLRLAERRFQQVRSGKACTRMWEGLQLRIDLG